MAINHLLSWHGAARILGLTERQLSRLVERGIVPHVMLPDGDVRFVEADLWAWVEARKQATGETPCQ
jgi:hypothetical protein